MWVSTFHSACVRILRRDAAMLGYKNTFSIYDDIDSRRLIDYCIRDLELDPKRFPPRGIKAAISNAKNELVDFESFAGQGSGPYHERVADIYRLYQQRLLEASAMDFDDLLMVTVELLGAFPQVLEHYQDRFRYVLVDEYQDTNHAQYRLVQLLAAKHRNLCVVGDSDQSIYAFRGADVRNILEFERDYSDARVIVLDRNYRSTQTILDAANAVIANNQGRKPKHLWTDLGSGDPVTVYKAEDEHDEAAFISERLGALEDSGKRLSDAAVFYRTHAQSRVLEEVLVRYGVPYQVIGGPKFYDRREVKDAMAYLRALVNPADEVAMKRIVNVPKRGIGATSIGHVDRFVEANGITFTEALARGDEITRLGARAVKQIAEFTALMDLLRLKAAEGPRAALQGVLDDTGYLAELESDGSLEALSRAENLKELLSVASEFEESGPMADLGDERWDDLDGMRRLELFLEATSAPQRQGPRVPRRVPRRHGGRRVPAHAFARRPRAARGGASARLRRDHQGAGAAVPHPCHDQEPVRLDELQLAEPLSRRDPGLAPAGGREAEAFAAARDLEAASDPGRRERGGGRQGAAPALGRGDRRLGGRRR
jgi:DNA helicase-2/ATP-dependent DNA helicase PcrA